MARGHARRLTQRVASPLNAVLSTPRGRGAAGQPVAQQAASPALGSAQKRSAVKSAGKWKTPVAKQAVAESHEGAEGQPSTSRDVEARVRKLIPALRSPASKLIFQVSPSQGPVTRLMAKLTSAEPPQEVRSSIEDSFLRCPARCPPHSPFEASSPLQVQASKPDSADKADGDARRGAGIGAEDAQPGPGSLGGKQTAAERLARWKASGAAAKVRARSHRRPFLMRSELTRPLHPSNQRFLFTQDKRRAADAAADEGRKPAGGKEQLRCATQPLVEQFVTFPSSDTRLFNCARVRRGADNGDSKQAAAAAAAQEGGSASAVRGID